MLGTRDILASSMPKYREQMRKLMKVDTQKHDQVLTEIVNFIYMVHISLPLPNISVFGVFLYLIL